MTDYFKYILLDATNKIIGNNELLYKIWLFITLRYIRGQKRELPAYGDDFYFDGYPRSGNTYAKNLLTFVYENVRGISHLHSKIGLKIALRKNIPSIIIIRNPKDAVSSNLFRKMNNGSIVVSEKRMVDILLKKYIRFYEYIESNSNNILLINFDELIDDEFKYIQIVSMYLKLDIHSVGELSNVIKKYKRHQKNKENMKNINVSSLPSESRNKNKEERLKIVMASEYFLDADSLYNRIIA